MTAPCRIDLATLAGLAPSDLTSKRVDRYDGGRMSVALAELGAANAARVRQLYTVLAELAEQLRVLTETPALDATDARRVLALPGWDEIVRLSRAIDNDRLSPQQSQVVHDVKGGALAALVGYASLLEFKPLTANALLLLSHYARDHLKMVRNCLPEIDPVTAARDRATRAHEVDLLIDKWGQGAFFADGAARQVCFTCQFEGVVAMRCMEFSALDRVIYNLMNNAGRHTADGRVDFAIFQPGGPDAAVRLAVANTISPEQRQTLEATYGGDVGRLFKGGFSTRGSGLGMRIAADFVCHAFGLQSPTEAIEGGYIGARLIDDRFAAWFHWPTFTEPAAS